jgi:hypothetical protein
LEIHFTHTFKFLLLLICFSGFNTVQSQDSTVRDTVSKTPKIPLRLFSFSDPHSPTKASIYSAVIPGLGQVYNQKYWKLPVIYAAMGGTAWFMLDQRKQMRKLNLEFKAAYALNKDTLISADLLSQRDNNRRFRDFGILALSAIYVLQIADATVDAHFFKLNIDQNLEAYLSPSPNKSFTLTYRF